MTGYHSKTRPPNTVEAKVKAEMDRIRKARNVAMNGGVLGREAPKRSPKLRKRFTCEKNGVKKI